MASRSLCFYTCLLLLCLLTNSCQNDLVDDSLYSEAEVVSIYCKEQIKDFSDFSSDTVHLDLAVSSPIPMMVTGDNLFLYDMHLMDVYRIGSDWEVRRVDPIMPNRIKYGQLFRGFGVLEGSDSILVQTEKSIYTMGVDVGRKSPASAISVDYCLTFNKPRFLLFQMGNYEDKCFYSQNAGYCFNGSNILTSKFNKDRIEELGLLRRIGGEMCEKAELLPLPKSDLFRPNKFHARYMPWMAQDHSTGRFYFIINPDNKLYQFTIDRLEVRMEKIYSLKIKRSELPISIFIGDEFDISDSKYLLHNFEIKSFLVHDNWIVFHYRPSHPLDVPLDQSSLANNYCIGLVDVQNASYVTLKYSYHQYSYMGVIDGNLIFYDKALSESVEAEALRSVLRLYDIENILPR